MTSDVELGEAGGLAYRSAGEARPLVLLHPVAGPDGSVFLPAALTLTERVTVLAIAAEHDRMPRALQQRFADASRGGTLAVIEGAGRFPFAETPERYWPVVGRWLDETAPQP